MVAENERNRDPRYEPVAGDVWQDGSYGRVEVMSAEGSGYGLRVTVSVESGTFWRPPGERHWDFQSFVKLLMHATIIQLAGN